LAPALPVGAPAAILPAIPAVPPVPVDVEASDNFVRRVRN